MQGPHIGGGMPPQGPMGGAPPMMGGGMPQVDPAMLAKILPILIQMLSGGGMQGGQEHMMPDGSMMPGGVHPGGPPMPPAPAPGGGGTPFSDWLRTKGVQPPM